MTETLFDVSGAIHRAAVVSECGTYRYTLERRWDDALPPVLFVMLNPSTADAQNDDPTIRRCIRFARDWGYGGVVVGNLYAYRATKPTDLPLSDVAVGPDNSRWLTRLREQAGLTVAAWGTHSRVAGRAAHVMRLLVEPHILGLTKNGNPRHPLYVPSATLPARWEMS